jgi:uncharacterized protein
MDFDWDPQKAIGNVSKHGVSFKEAKTVFDNPLAVIFDDEINSVNEQREIIVGHSSYNRLLMVSFTERPSSIRLISARLVTPKERDRYERSLF